MCVHTLVEHLSIAILDQGHGCCQPAVKQKAPAMKAMKAKVAMKAMKAKVPAMKAMTAPAMKAMKAKVPAMKAMTAPAMKAMKAKVGGD